MKDMTHQVSCKNIAPNKAFFQLKNTDIFFLFLYEKICSGHSLEVLLHMFLWRNKEYHVDTTLIRSYVEKVTLLNYFL